MAIFLMFFAGICVSLSNLFMRKSMVDGGSAKGFLVFQMLTAFFVAFFLNPVRTGDYAWNPSITVLGVIAGTLLALLLFFLGRSFETGPAGLTVSILNASTLVPAIVMFLAFGASFGFPYTIWHAFGSILVLFGLFLGVRGAMFLENWKKWLKFSLLVFSFHVMILVLYQWRAFLLNLAHPEEISFFTLEQIKSQWFAPVLYATAMIWQLFFFIRYEKRSPFSLEVSYGILGGVLNGLCTYFMIWSTEVALPFENAVIFPIFSVTTIIASNLWGQKLYQEKVDWRACQFCALGLFIGTVDWKSAMAVIGF